MERQERREQKKRALIAMSGGVDSSVAAALMKEQGFDCIGCTMMLHPESDHAPAGTHTCCSLDDTLDARAVCDALGIPFYVLNFTDDFGAKVIDKFVRVYEAGGTPNPCIDCNRYMKFEQLYARARQFACDTIVTGHYARIRQDGETGRMQLLRAANPDKDQTYVLYAMTQDQLAHTAFPLGEFADKEQVREAAERYGFRNAHKPDSQDLCFVPTGKYADFIRERTGRAYPPGDFVDEEGNVLGTHRGIIRYTIGQRKGLGLALPESLYVKEKDLEHNRVILARESSLFSDTLAAEDFNWIAPAPQPGETLRVTAKPRYRAVEAPATAVVREDGTVQVVFDAPQRALTCGQAVVLYDGEKVVGGGTICKVGITTGAAV